MPRPTRRTATLPADLTALVTDPRLSLAGGRFHEFVVNVSAQTVKMVVDSGDVTVGYRRLTLTFHGATIEPDDLSRLADAVGAEFRANHWHQRRTVTEIERHAVREIAKGRYVLELQLRPFHEFSIQFAGFALVEEGLSRRAASVGGRFVLAQGAES